MPSSESFLVLPCQLHSFLANVVVHNSYLIPHTLLYSEHDRSQEHMRCISTPRDAARLTYNYLNTFLSTKSDVDCTKIFSSLEFAGILFITSTKKIQLLLLQTLTKCKDFTKNILGAISNNASTPKLAYIPVNWCQPFGCHINQLR